MHVDMDWRVLLALALLVAMREVDWDHWRKMAAMYKNGTLFEKARKARAA